MASPWTLWNPAAFLASGPVAQECAEAAAARTVQAAHADDNDLLGLRLPWKCKVVLCICNANVWTSLTASLTQDRSAIWVDFDETRQGVLSSLNNHVPWWSSYKVQSLATLVEASIGPWTYRVRTMRAAAKAIQEAQRLLDFRPIVVRVPPLEALEFKVCLEACLPAECSLLAPKSVSDFAAVMQRPPDEPWYRALPFFSKLFEDTQ